MKTLNFILLIGLILNFSACKSKINVKNLNGTYKSEDEGAIYLNNNHSNYRKVLYGTIAEKGNYIIINNKLILRPTYCDSIFKKYSKYGLMKGDTFEIFKANDSIIGLYLITERTSYEIHSNGKSEYVNQSEKNISIDTLGIYFNKTNEDLIRNSFLNSDYWTNENYERGTTLIANNIDDTNSKFLNNMAIRQCNSGLLKFPENSFFLYSRGMANFNLRNMLEAYLDFKKLDLKRFINNPYFTYEYAAASLFIKSSDIRFPEMLLDISIRTSDSVYLATNSPSIQNLLIDAHRIRGYLYFSKGESKKACSDWEFGANLNDKNSIEFLKTYCYK
jgi:hypothetical protein